MEYYDLYVSIGPACRPAYHLNSNFLRKSSTPLDWQTGYSLETVIHLFNTNFQDFFVDIEEVEECGADNNRKVIDKKNEIISLHHFSKDMLLEDARVTFYETMQKRYEKLNEKLKSINKVCLICNRTNTLEEFSCFLKKFNDIYPYLELRLINIRSDSNLANDIQKNEYSLNNKLSIVEYS